MKKRSKIILAVSLAFLLLLGVSGYAYVADYYRADEVAMAAMAYQADDVQIKEDGNVTWFVPKESTAGLIFYPGGKVEHTAYAPLLRACAEKGILSPWFGCPATWRCWVPTRRMGFRKSIRRSRVGT